MLILLWLFSLALAAISLFGILVLIAARLIGKSRKARWNRARKTLMAAMLSWLEGGVADKDILKTLKRQRTFAAPLIFEVFEMMRGEEREKLAALAEKAGIGHVLRRHLLSGKRYVRINAAENLAWFPGDATKAALRKTLAGQDGDVALNAARTLTDLGEPVPLDALAAASMKARRDPSRLLEDIFRRVALPQRAELIALLEQPRFGDRVRIAALEALAKGGDYALIAVIEPYALDPSPAFRARIAQALGILGHPDAREALAVLLRDPGSIVRAAAAEAVGKTGLLDLSDALCALLDDPDGDVRRCAAQAMMMLGEDGIDRLRAIAFDASHPRGWWTAALALAERNLA